MSNSRSSPLLTALKVGVCALILKVTLAVVWNYPDYLPPDFSSDFLQGRQSYFWGTYHWAFYMHLASGPVSLLLGMILISERFRLRFPMWHRSLGKAQCLCVLFFVTPSGLWMSYHAMTGAMAAFGFAFMALATGTFVTLGWLSAVRRRFVDHRRWMQRCFVLLCSAVVIRLIGGLATAMNFDSEWLYPVTAWASWLVPLSILELSHLQGRLGGLLLKSDGNSTQVAVVDSFSTSKVN